MKHILLTFIMGFSLFAQTQNYQTVDVDEFERFTSDTTVIILDVRTAAEHAEGFIPGTHYNMDVLEETFEKIVTETLSKNQPIALYCRSGNRSKNAARILAEKGYRVVELGTGFRGWQTAGKEIEVKR